MHVTCRSKATCSPLEVFPELFIYGTLVAVSADNLGSYALGGFKESTAYRACRQLHGYNSRNENKGKPLNTCGCLTPACVCVHTPVSPAVCRYACMCMYVCVCIPIKVP